MSEAILIVRKRRIEAKFLCACAPLSMAVGWDISSRTGIIQVSAAYLPPALLRPGVK
ncbi:MAG: hypothetical protein PHD51_03815 [Patescibacteria group bacterium]|nr:hypothetical protein [Patescibacteria group bacterium]MDD5490902.1 hypothetical protein [Patescibacteria group bacterium]